jgi:multidrug efflux pump subunit AcrA (membrane-fusion protein)
LISESIPPETENMTEEKKSSPLQITLTVGIILLVLCALFAFGYQRFRDRQHVVEASAVRVENAIPTVSVAKIRRAAKTASLVLPGNTMPLTEASIYARASGYVRQRFVDIGDRVRQGQLLAEIEAPELDQQVAQAKAAVAQAERQLEQSKADLNESRAKMELARITWDRYRVLVEHGAISRQEGDQQQTNFRSTSAAVNSIEARIGSAEQNVQASRASLDRLLTLQSFEKVRAPFDGVITVRNFDAGALISGSGGSLGQGVGMGPGGSAASSASAQGSELFRIAQVSVLRVLVNIPEVNAPGIRSGQIAEIQTQAFPNRKFQGRVIRTANAIDVSSRTMLTEIQASNPGNLLLPGMFVQVRLENTRAEPPFIIPGDSLITTSKGLRVAVAESLPAGTAKSHPADARQIHLKPIQIGNDNGLEIEILGGLDGAEELIVNPGDDTVEGALVRPIPKASPK